MVYTIVQTHLGTILLTGDEQGLHSLAFAGEDLVPEGMQRDDILLAEAAKQINEYLAGSRHTFELELVMQGTPFQMAVWKALMEIPFGETCTYQEIAVRIGRPSAVRAVGAANRKNPIPLIVPCHRVIGKDGSLTGYAYGTEMKQRLLDLEQL